MKLLFELILFFSTAISAQSFEVKVIDSLFSSAPDLLLQTNLSDSVYAKPFVIFRLEDGESILLKKNQTVEASRGIYAPYIAGSWKFDFQQKVLTVVSKKRQKQFYYLIRYKSFLYLIPPWKLIEFISRYKISIEKHKNTKPYQLEKDGKFYIWQDLVVTDLSGENYTSNYWD